MNVMSRKEVKEKSTKNRFTSGSLTEASLSKELKALKKATFLQFKSQ